jgi:hypothetical protein
MLAPAANCWAAEGFEIVMAGLVVSGITTGGTGLLPFLHPENVMSSKQITINCCREIFIC